MVTTIEIILIILGISIFFLIIFFLIKRLDKFNEKEKLDLSDAKNTACHGSMQEINIKVRK